MRAFIDELYDEYQREALLRVKLQFPQGVNLDLSKLIVCGHSFGGMTSIDVARLEPIRVKACLTFDPWLYCQHGLIKEREY